VEHSSEQLCHFNNFPSSKQSLHAKSIAVSIDRDGVLECCVETHHQRHKFGRSCDGVSGEYAEWILFGVDQFLFTRIWDLFTPIFPLLCLPVNVIDAFPLVSLNII
jgi:hypothetical protein